MKDIIDEVKEDLQSEELADIVKKYSKYVIAFAAIAVIFTSIFTYIKHRNETKQEEYSKSFYSVLKADTAMPESLKEETNIYSDLSRLEIATKLRDKKEYKKSIETLYSVIETSKYDELKNLAKIHLIMTAIKYNISSDIVKTELLQTAEHDAPFAEILNWSIAQLHLKNGNPDKVRNIATSKNTNDQYNVLDDILLNSINKN